ncbi:MULTISPECIES: sugar ABC transporter ATP-binding protein [unclassified Streptomyces]|uniref:sugar ABC transporter ATP-binding protein n=1 Tax=unclassified Streptomyces TaxID=2593676 RepID=UPI002E8146CA|nr:sugar ABC transporter ATP-binding protein [Streptomyces sp. NBC_00589]WTI34508.1 sugar ABC transporter ATP-binding protein [Streptomyces sp. NBC_00775]WUB31820.1 sugar ABC transporter ATP-binding protein [Streptomyces sp. NBC_00589]
MSDGDMLAARGLVKSYGGVRALDGAGISLRGGEVHALVGENGAGKSTLVRILSGTVAPDDGTVLLAKEARADGIAVVSQELSLFPDLTVRENLYPYRPPRRFGLLDRGAMDRAARPVLAELGLDVDPGTLLGELPLADQQLTEIARALLRRPKILVLDEPTSALPGAAVDRLEQVLRTLTGQGIAVLYVTHFLEEVMRFAQRVTVLRDGRVALAGARREDVDVPELVTAMLGGRPPQPVRRARAVAEGPPPVVLSEVSVPGRLADVTFTVRAGEVVGVAGLQGAGHLAALEVVCGRTAISAGRVDVGGRGLPRSLRAAVRAGVAFVPSDRKRYGLMAERMVWENATAVSWLALGRGGVLPSRTELVRRTADLTDRLRLRGGPYDIVARLSGGNQQKVVFAKWLATEPRIVVLDDPTRGVDVGVRAEMHRIVGELAAGGAAVLIASTDLAELTEVCDRVLVFVRGRIVGEVHGERLTEHALAVAVQSGLTRRG